MSVTAALVLALAGCSSNDDDGPGPDVVEGGDGSGSGEDGGLDNPDDADNTGALIEGEWESACLAATADSQAVADRVVLSVVGQVFTLTETAYGDMACTSELNALATRGSFVELGPDDGQQLEDGFPLDLSISQHNLTPLLAQVSDQYNMQALCDSTDWMAGVDRDVSTCAALFGTATAPRTDYNRYFVDNQMTIDVRSDDVLLLGALSPVTNEADRPMQVSQELRFTRRAQ